MKKKCGELKYFHTIFFLNSHLQTYFLSILSLDRPFLPFNYISYQCYYQSINLSIYLSIFNLTFVEPGDFKDNVLHFTSQHIPWISTYLIKVTPYIPIFLSTFYLTFADPGVIIKDSNLPLASQIPNPYQISL